MTLSVSSGSCCVLRVPLQKIRAFYKIIENLHNKVILVIKLRLKSHLKEIIIASKYTKIIFATEPENILLFHVLCCETQVLIKC
jgi:hypothetical protein